MTPVALIQKHRLPVYKKIFFSIAAFVNVTALIIFAMARLLFAGFRISLAEDMLILLQTLGMAAIISLLLFSLYLLVEMADMLLQQKKLFRWSYAGLAAAVLLVILVAASCAQRKAPGIKKMQQPVSASNENSDSWPVTYTKIINYADI